MGSDLAAYTRPSGIICEHTGAMTQMSAKVIRIGKEDECAVFEKGGFVYATILGDVPKSRPFVICCEVKDTDKSTIVSDRQRNGVGVGQGDGGDLLSVFADSRNQRMVRGHKNEAALGDLVN